MLSDRLSHNRRFSVATETGKADQNNSIRYKTAIPKDYLPEILISRQQQRTIIVGMIEDDLIRNTGIDLRDVDDCMSFCTKSILRPAVLYSRLVHHHVRIGMDQIDHQFEYNIIDQLCFLPIISNPTAATRIAPLIMSCIKSRTFKSDIQL